MRSVILRAGWVAGILGLVTPSAAGVDGLRYSDDGGRAQAKELQQRLQGLATDKTADVGRQSAEIAGRMASAISRLDLSRPAIPKAGVVCSELLGPWFSQEPMLRDTNQAAVDPRVAFGRAQTARCMEAARAHVLRNRDMIAKGMVVWIEARLAAKAAIGTSEGWCTGFAAQNEWWPLRSFYPDDLINGVVASCKAGAAPLLAKVAHSRVASAIEAAGRVDRTIAAMTAAKWLAMPEFGIGDPALALAIRGRYEAAVEPIRREVTDEVEDGVERAYGGKVAVDRAIWTTRAACRQNWTKTLFSSPEDGARVIDRKCGEAEQAFARRACRHALDRANMGMLGWSKVMAAPRNNGSLAPVTFDGLVCAAAIDGFRVEISHSWMPFSTPSLMIRSTKGGPVIAVTMRKVTRDNGVRVWLAEDVAGSGPLATATDVMTCFQNTIDDSDAMTIATSVGYMAAHASGFDVSLADVFGLVGTGVSAAQCKSAKRGWLADAL